MLLTDIQREWAERAYHVVLFAVVFVLIGYLVPRIYYQFIDNRQYLTVVQPITYDKKEYKPCEVATAIIKYRATIDTPAEVRTKVYKVEDSGFKVISESRSETAIAKTPDDGAKILTETRVPCTYGDGIYFYEAVVTYEIKGVKKSYSFISTQVEISRDE